MIITTAIVLAAKLVALASLTAAAYSDIVRRIIPNRMVLIVAGSGLVIRAIESASQPVWVGIAAAVGVFAVLRLLAGFGLLGGGDVKLMSALVLGERISAVMPLLAATAVAGGVLACGYAAINRAGQFQGRRAGAGAGERRPPPLNDGPGAAEPLRTEIPYGVAILAGALLVEFWRF